MRYLLTLIVCSFIITAHAQNVGIGTKNPKSKLHVAGDLRVDALAKDSGLLVHDQQGLIRSIKLTGTKNDVLYGDGSFAPLNAVLATSASWLTLGNTGTDPTINFIGTIDDQPLRFRVGNSWAGNIDFSSGVVAFGANSLMNNTTGHTNTAFGNSALELNTTGYNNIGIGAGALTFNTTGWQNIAIGVNCLTRNTNGNGNISIGHGALYYNTTGTINLAIGSGALQNNTTASGLMAIGHLALNSNTSGTRNTALGSSAMRGTTSGSNNVATGYNTLFANSTGSYNTAYGVMALYNNTTASRNVAVGFEAMFTNTVGASNVAVGSRSMWSNRTGHSTVAIGDSALFMNTYGIYNTAVGELALSNNLTGNYNVSTGGWALIKNTSGSNNTGSGYRALAGTTSGSGNTAVGYQSLLINVNGTNNTAIGNSADVTTGTLTNATAIGYNAKVNASNKVRIGNASITKIEGQVPFTTPSDGRYKFNIREDVQGLSFIMRLRPVTYQFDVNRWDGIDDNSPISNEMKISYAKAMELRRTGFIAQQVETAAQQSGFDFSGINRPETNEDRYSLSYESFVVPLVKGMQEQQVIIHNLNEKVKSQEQLIQTLAERLNKLEAKQEKN
jgi:trimeric autotransporter adhesin